MAFLIRIVVVALLWSASITQARDLPDFTRLVEETGPSVVNISTSQKAKSTRLHSPHGHKGPAIPDDLDKLFRHFFGEHGDDDSNSNDGEKGSDREAQSLGSGFIISSDGYILTNYHVVNGADEVIVRLTDRRELVAKVVGGDERSDVALVKIDAKDLPTVRLGDPTRLKVGEWVLAIGSPFGFDHSATAGIVSALGRSLPSENYVPFIQTDVAINPGNSGGPLFNLAGEVVGINSQIYSRTGGFMGLSFAIPIDVAMDSVEQIKGKGYVSRGWLGVLIQDVTRELAESFGMERPEGALVARILPNSPATNTGLEVGDVIVEFNGRRINQSSTLPPLVGRTPVGSSADVKVLRGGQERALKIKIGELPNEDEVRQVTATPRATKETLLGMVITDPTAEQRKGAELKEQGGVLVQEITEGPAQRAGVRQGDIIIMLNGAKVKDAAHLKTLVKDLPSGRTVPLLVQRNGSPQFLAIRP